MEQKFICPKIAFSAADRAFSAHSVDTKAMDLTGTKNSRVRNKHHIDERAQAIASPYY